MGNVCICTPKRRSSYCQAHPGFKHKPARLTPKQRILMAEPKARLDYREMRRNAGKPCWFIRVGFQGQYLHWGLFSTPRGAWRAAEKHFLDSFQVVPATERKAA